MSCSSRPVSRRLRLAAAAFTVVAAVAGPGALAGPAAAAPARAVAADPVESYVRAVYQDLFGRPPDPGGLAGWTAALAGGTPYSAVASAIANSREYRTRVILTTYLAYLGHGPDPVGLDGWLTQLDQGLQIEQMQAGVLGSTEYYVLARKVNREFVRSLYVRVLGRTPVGSSGEVDFWVAAIKAGTTRTQVATSILSSTEHLSTVVDGYYRTYLGRPADQAGLSGWVAALQGGSRDEQVLAQILSSAEYRAQV